MHRGAAGGERQGRDASVRVVGCPTLRCSYRIGGADSTR